MSLATKAMLNFSKKVQMIETVCNDSENPMEEQTGAEKTTVEVVEAKGRSAEVNSLIGIESWVWSTEIEG